jgi:hypothetical protein
LRAHASGLAEVANGFGKILGPLGLAVIAGTSNIVNLEATREAITPALYFLAAFSLLTALAFMLIPETRRKTLRKTLQARRARSAPQHIGSWLSLRAPFGLRRLKRVIMWKMCLSTSQL